MKPDSIKKRAQVLVRDDDLAARLWTPSRIHGNRLYRRNRTFGTEPLRLTGVPRLVLPHFNFQLLCLVMPKEFRAFPIDMIQPALSDRCHRHLSSLNPAPRVFRVDRRILTLP
ncbi:MAG: hypothetical protein AB7I50_09210, partial [Vicinamibacterales bacterium]